MSPILIGIDTFSRVTTLLKLCSFQYEKWSTLKGWNWFPPFRWAMMHRKANRKSQKLSPLSPNGGKSTKAIHSLSFTYAKEQNLPPFNRRTLCGVSSGSTPFGRWVIGYQTWMVKYWLCVIQQMDLVMSRNMRKCTFWHVHPTKIQVNLGICAVWSESSSSLLRNSADSHPKCG